MFRSIWVLILSFVLCGWGAAAARKTPQLTVVVYNDAGVPERIVKQAEGITERIYRNAGVAIEWQDRAHSTTGESSFSVRIVSRSLNLQGEDVGIAFVGRDGLGVQADVFYSGIERLARSSSVGAGDILGHVMAHELGHLLLGLDSHSNLGIMQARWRRGQLRQISMGILGFDRRESEIMRARLLGPYAALRSGTKTAQAASVTKAFLPQM